MSPTPEELLIGEKAYRWVQRYEKSVAMNVRAKPWIFVTCFGLFALILIFDPPHKHSEIHQFIFVAPICFVWMFWQNRTAKQLHASYKLTLQLLKEKYGESLPWLVEEKQLASARELEAAIAKDRSASHA